MSHGIFLLSQADQELNPGPLKGGAQPPRVHTTRTAKNSWKNIDKFIGSALDMSVLSQLRKR